MAVRLSHHHNYALAHFLRSIRRIQPQYCALAHFLRPIRPTHPHNYAVAHLLRPSNVG